MENSAFVIEGSRLVKCTDPDLEEIIVPEGITEIGEGAFWCHRSLKRLLLPAGVTAIGDDAFWDCTALEELHLPAGLLCIGNGAFSECAALEELHLPEGLVSIGQGAFLNCRKLKSPLLPKSLREIGPRAFAKCWNIRQRWRVHKENPWIRAEGALLLTANGREVLHCRPWAKGEILVPEGVERIRRGAFFACVRVTNVLFPPGLRAIEEVAFADCGSLRKICLPEGLEELGGLQPHRKNTITWLDHPVLPGTRPPTKECTGRDPWLQIHR